MAMTSPLSVFARKKKDGQKIAMISLYDAPSALLAADAGADALLVGDSLGNVLLGYANTIPVTMDDMIRHTGAVVRGVLASKRPEVAVVADLPFGSYATTEMAVKNSVALMQAGAHAVKLEGCPRFAVRNLVENGIPVMGHLGFTPQSVLQFDGIVQGKTGAAIRSLEYDFSTLGNDGCFAVVLEAVTREVAAFLTEKSSIPTIGIGAGPDCDGQILVWNDLVGLSPQKLRFVRKYAETREIWEKAAHSYVAEVQGGHFPQTEHGWEMAPDELEQWQTEKATWESDEFDDSDPFDEP